MTLHGFQNYANLDLEVILLFLKIVDMQQEVTDWYVGSISRRMYIQGNAVRDK